MSKIFLHLQKVHDLVHDLEHYSPINHFNLLKQSLLFCCTPIRHIPIAKINLFSTFFSGNKPMRALMQSTTKKTMGKAEPMVGTLGISRLPLPRAFCCQAAALT